MLRILITALLFIATTSLVHAAGIATNPHVYARFPEQAYTSGYISGSIFLSTSSPPLSEAKIFQENMGVVYSYVYDKCIAQYRASTAISATGSIELRATPNGLFFIDHAYASAYVSMQIENDTRLEQSVSISDRAITSPISLSVDTGTKPAVGVSWTPTFAVEESKTEKLQTNIGYIRTPSESWINHDPGVRIEYTKPVALIMAGVVQKEGAASARCYIGSIRVDHVKGSEPLIAFKHRDH